MNRYILHLMQRPKNRRSSKKRARKKKKTKRRQKRLGCKISRPLAWIEKYLWRARNQMPMMTMPRAIRSFRPNPKKHHLTLGSCCKSDRSVNLATHYIKVVGVKGRKKKVAAQLSRLSILQTLAHELSHLAYDKHGYEQEWYGRTIFNTFGVTEPCPHCHGKGQIPARYEND